MNNFKQLRTKSNILQIKLTLDLNLSQETVSSYETGRVGVNDDMLIKLADYYNTNIAYILCRIKYDLLIDCIKPYSISEKDFQFLIKIDKLLATNQLKVEVYETGVIDLWMSTKNCKF